MCIGLVITGEQMNTFEALGVLAQTSYHAKTCYKKGPHIHFCFSPRIPFLTFSSILAQSFKNVDNVEGVMLNSFAISPFLWQQSMLPLLSLFSSNENYQCFIFPLLAMMIGWTVFTNVFGI